MFGVIDRTQFSLIVGDIYDCVLDPPRWVDTLSRIASIMRSAGSSIVINDDFDLKGGRIFEHGADQKYLRALLRTSLDSRPAAASRTKTQAGIPMTLEALGEEQPGAKDFFRDFVQPLGFNDLIALQLLRSGRRAGWLSVARSGIQPRFAERERAIDELVVAAPVPGSRAVRRHRYHDLDRRPAGADRRCLVRRCVSRPIGGAHSLYE